ncbi:hypothetical protein PLICRDRAFT_401847 [Plicaturopsis crispa FD-325 SS-3]|nr:hypothetical protein PLICRDRAFT_401847 [Plicaturopsis crispa FD-325 SS-3]
MIFKIFLNTVSPPRFDTSFSCMSALAQRRQDGIERYANASLAPAQKSSAAQVSSASPLHSTASVGSMQCLASARTLPLMRWLAAVKCQCIVNAAGVIHHASRHRQSCVSAAAPLLAAAVRCLSSGTLSPRSAWLHHFAASPLDPSRGRIKTVDLMYVL